MARIAFKTVQEWMDLHELQPADAARLFGVTSQTFNGWKVRDHVSMNATDEVAEVMRTYGRRISDSAMALDYVRVDQIDAEGGMGDGRVNGDYPEVIRSVEYGESFIRALIGFLPPPGRLKLVTGAGDSMRPIIEPGEPMLMDSGVREFDKDGIYWIGLGDADDGLQVKMLQQRGDGLWVVSANPVYPPFPFPKHGRIGGKLYIKHKLERFN